MSKKDKLLADVDDPSLKRMGELMLDAFNDRRRRIRGAVAMLNERAAARMYPDEYTGYGMVITEVYLAFNGSLDAAHKSLKGAMGKLLPGGSVKDWFPATLNGKLGDLWYPQDAALRSRGVRIERRDLDG